MNRIIKKRIKKYFLCVAVLILSVSIFSNSSIFAHPVRVFASKFSSSAVSLVLPTPNNNSQANPSTDSEKTVEEKSTVPTEKKSENKTKPAEKTVSAEKQTVRRDDHGGRLRSG